MADDFLSKKKENGPVLDLSKATCSSKEDFRKMLDKVPEFKIRAEKVRTEDIKIRDKDFKFKTSKKDLKVLTETYNFANPIPVEMRSVNLEDLIAVPIDWRMLTTLRPKSKVDEDYFSRFVCFYNNYNSYNNTTTITIVRAIIVGATIVKPAIVRATTVWVTTVGQL